MLVSAEHSAVLCVDIQEKLMPLIEEGEQCLNNCKWVLALATTLEQPIYITEQYPKGLGYTVDDLSEYVKVTTPFEKVSFSCLGAYGLKTKLDEKNTRQIIIIGIETHVCILQTALDLLQQHYEVFVVRDATASRHQSDYLAALDRMKHAGVTLITKEMLLFEWLRQSKHEKFKEISKTFLT